MSLKNFTDGLATQLAADTNLIAWMAGAGGTMTVIKGNTPVDMIEPDEKPAVVIELGDGDLGIQLGGGRQDVEAEVLIAIVWSEDDAATAFDRRTTLPGLFAQAISKDHTLGNKVEGAWVSSYESDRNILHPDHVFRFGITGQFEEVAP